MKGNIRYATARLPINIGFHNSILEETREENAETFHVEANSSDQNILHYFWVTTVLKNRRKGFNCEAAPWTVLRNGDFESVRPSFLEEQWTESFKQGVEEVKGKKWKPSNKNGRFCLRGKVPAGSRHDLFFGTSCFLLWANSEVFNDGKRRGKQNERFPLGTSDGNFACGCCPFVSPYVSVELFGVAQLRMPIDIRFHRRISTDWRKKREQKKTRKEKITRNPGRRPQYSALNSGRWR